ncbi:MAG: helix-turn-helix domain-containing protein [Paludibacter sp.]
MLLYISLFGVFLSLTLMYFNVRNYSSSIYLGIYFILVCIYGISSYIFSSSKSVFWVSMICTNITFIFYIIGPLSYKYVHSVINDNAQLKLKDLWHLVPMLIYLICALPYIFSTYAFKVEIAKSIVADPRFLSEYHFTVLSDLLTTGGVFLSRPLLVFGYAIASCVELYRYSKTIKSNESPLGNRMVIRWLITFLCFQFLITVSHIFFLFENFKVAGRVLIISEEVLNSLSSFGLIGLIISPILFPRILYGLPDLSATSFKNNLNELNNQVSESVQKKSYVYEEEYMHFINEKIDECMSKHQLYLQKELNLPQLSVLLNIPTHHLAYFFSGYMEITFSDYRNIYRIEHAKKLITNQKTSLITLEAIALLSGFTNRNTFSKVFKDLEGVSPSAFAAHL